jgi:hypothetical protein
VWEERELHRGSWYGEKKKERNHLQDFGVDGKIILTFTLKWDAQE